MALKSTIVDIWELYEPGENLGEVELNRFIALTRTCKAVQVLAYDYAACQMAVYGPRNDAGIPAVAIHNLLRSSLTIQDRQNFISLIANAKRVYGDTYRERMAMAAVLAAWLSVDFEAIKQPAGEG